MDNTTYEFFIRRAWGNIDRFEKGADADLWNSLLMDRANLNDSIGTPKEAKYSRAFEKSFDGIKGFVNRAFVQLIKKAERPMLGDSDLAVLRQLAVSAAAANNEQQLFQILRRSMEIMNAHKL